MLLASMLLVVFTQTPPVSAGVAPGVRPLFASESWYKNAKAEEKVFEGVLEINSGEGRIGMPARFNSFRLTSLEEGKPVIRQVYTGGKDHLLSPFFNWNVKLTAKLVETDVEGSKVAELWPALIDVISPAAAGVIAEWKILARSNGAVVPNRQFLGPPQPTVIRTGKHLAEFMGHQGTVAEETATLSLAKTFGPNVKIDWSKHMILGLSGGNRGGFSKIEVSKITFGEKGLDVHWKLSGQNLGGANRMAELVLIEKYDGNLRFFQEGTTRPVVVPGPQATPKKTGEPS